MVKCGDGDLTDEMTQLEEMGTALKASQSAIRIIRIMATYLYVRAVEYAMLFVSELVQPTAFINAPQRRRSLKSDEEDEERTLIDYGFCDELCKVRSLWPSISSIMRGSVVRFV